MNKEITNLLSEMKAVFGDAFGKHLPEAKEPMFGRERPTGKESKKGRDARYRAKQKQDKAMADFHAHADAEGAKSAAKPKPKKSKFSGTSQHYPFKRSDALGHGPGTPPGYRKVHGARPHDENRCWHCRCANYKCDCVGTGATKNCRRGRHKPIKIKTDYRRAYNKLYRPGYDHSIHRWSAKKHKEHHARKSASMGR